MLSASKILQFNIRKFSRYIDKDRTSKAIRQRFLDYFINKHAHNFVKSSPVVPFCDPSIAFVNAGMNQFKEVLIGSQEVEHKKVANSQKCIRVGGKHNDLRVVGTDGYHHTFFEMLGSWSFGQYFKEEACELAWKLLTEEYKIHPSRLYVTYFEGDPRVGIEEDLETREIWRSLGISEDRILPFCSKDNFWEMGATGPCGPCTEIHIDHIGATSRAELVNRGLHDLTELWNIVFIQYNRKSSDTIEPLPQKHVDTGMGFERLTAFLQGKISNYDTDNFSYLLQAIHKNCRDVEEYKGRFGENDWDNLDTSYRILADHTRMITVCLADGIIPEGNQKLRRIMRKVFLLSENVFRKPDGLLKELTNYVIERLGPVYCELERNSKQIQQIIDYEEDVYKSIRKTALNEWEKLSKENPKLASLDIMDSPSLVAAYKEIKTTNPTSVTDKLAFKLYDTFGVDEEGISKLAEACNLQFDPQDLRKELESAKMRSKNQSVLANNTIHDQLVKEKIPKTNRTPVYNCAKRDGKYVFEKRDVRVLKIFENMESVNAVGPETPCAILLDKSNFYAESGGQMGDEGTISFADHVFQVTDVQNIHGYILHKGFFNSSKNFQIKCGMSGTLNINWENRLEKMKNHTGVHLLNAVLRDCKGAVCQKSSRVTEKYLNIDVGIFSDKLTVNEIKQIEEKVEKLIENKIEVCVSEIDSRKLSSLDCVTLIPGEIYPDSGIRIVEIKGSDGFLSREPCCGTHVFSTNDLKEFSIISVKSLGRSTASIHAVTGDRAKIAKANGAEILRDVSKLETSHKEYIDTPEVVNKHMDVIRKKLKYSVEDSSIVPFVVKQQCIETLNKISKEIRDKEKENMKDFVEKEMESALKSKILRTKNNQEYMVHFFESNRADNVTALQNATKMCPHIPILIISCADGVVKARCCVPKNLQSKSFGAEDWLKETVVAAFEGNILPVKGQDSSLVCNMKSKRVNTKECYLKLEQSLEAARKYVEERL